jgi:uncharacterized iron-regulated membrane protein
MAERSPSLRQAYSALHTWMGVVLGGVLFAIFFMGTLSVFDREIDRWMMPGTRLPAAPAAISIDRQVRPLIEQLGAADKQWSVSLPSERTPTLLVRYEDADGNNVSRHVDPSSGALIADQGTLGGTGFIFPFHFRLHLSWLDLGLWLVGLAGMAMMLLLVTGVIIHRRIFRDFFTFRAHKPLQRSSLDLHNLAGVLGLPFHFTMAFSGLVIFFSLYLPWTWKAAYQGDNAAFSADVFGNYRRPALKAPGSVGSIDAMRLAAERRWGDGSRASFVRVANPADAASTVEVRRSGSKDVSLSRERVYFDGASGQVLSTYDSPPIARVQRFISGIHFTQFDDWALRWLYFLGGASGCVLIATGLLVWLASRRKQHEREGRAGVRLVEAMAVAAVPGIMVATLAFFIANRCLPAAASLAGEGRADLEMWVFYTVWLATFTDAGLRAGAAWRDQAWAIAVLAPVAVLANWLSTGDHPLRALERGVPVVAGMDALLVLAGGVALWTARRLGRERVPARKELRAPAVLAPAQSGERHA